MVRQIVGPRTGPRWRGTLLAVALLASIVSPPLQAASARPSAGPSTVASDQSFAWDAFGGEESALAAARVLIQALSDQATVETLALTVEWSPAGATRWQTNPSRQVVRAGDRLRTGASGSARLTYFEGSETDVSPNTSVVVQRLARTPAGNPVTSLVQSVGTTVSRVLNLLDPAASFEVDTPAATAFVRGTTPRVIVSQDGRQTQVQNIPDGSGGDVQVVGKDPGRSAVSVSAGLQTTILQGQAPQPPQPIPAQQLQPLQQQQQQRQRQQQTPGGQQGSQEPAGGAAGGAPAASTSGGGAPGGEGDSGGAGTGGAATTGQTAVLPGGEVSNVLNPNSAATDNLIPGSIGAGAASGSQPSCLGTAPCVPTVPRRLLPLPRGSQIVPPTFPAAAPAGIPPVVGAGTLAVVPPRAAAGAGGWIAEIDVDLGAGRAATVLLEPDVTRALAVRVTPAAARAQTEGTPASEATLELVLDVYELPTGRPVKVPLSVGVRQKDGPGLSRLLAVRSATRERQVLAGALDPATGVLRVELNH